MGRYEENKLKGTNAPTGEDDALSIMLPSFAHMEGQFHPVAQNLFVEDATDVALNGSQAELQFGGDFFV